jgi:hypothetical protein
MRHILIPLAVTIFASGCSSDAKAPMAGTPETTRATLVVALEGWKAGKTYQDLSNQAPALYVVDDDLNRGTRLLDYQIEGEGKVLGTGYSYVVTLIVQDRDGARAPSKRKVAYTVVTEPKLAVTREDRKV